VPLISALKKKENLWKYLLARAENVGEQPIIFIGDFNTGRQDLDRSGGERFHCAEYMDKLEQAQLTDVWRLLNSGTREYSRYSHSGNGFRIDHAFVSPGLINKVVSAQYIHIDREAKISDHAALLVSLALAHTE
jgi:exodeoxyribonuclease-3